MKEKEMLFMMLSGRVDYSGRTPIRAFVLLSVIAVGVWSPDVALAHDEGDGGAGFAVGLFHPVLGFDHFLAMLSVGIISAQNCGRAIWYTPLTFVLSMIVGSILGIRGIGILSVEAGIAASVLVLGTILATERLFPKWLAVVAVAVFGIFHGHAHGTEMPLIANPWLYGAGFVTGTAIIHLTGVLIGFGFRRIQLGESALRVAGASIVAAGAYLLFTL